MILILSTDGDTTTSEVLEWLIAFKAPFFRLNDNDIFKSAFNCYTENGKVKFSITKDDKTLHSDDVTMVWYRKFGFYNFSDEYKVLKNTSNIDLLRQFSSEYFTVLNVITATLKSRRWLLNMNQATTNKYLVLNEAKNAGLNIPDSNIINCKKSLENIIEKGNNVITKTLKEASLINYNKLFLSMFTTEISPDELRTTPEYFMPSLIQRKIEKEFEIRAFFINSDYYAMAIFSQADNQTEVDFRKYNRETPNRCVPYTIPKALKSKLQKLMKNLKLNTGSVDLIYTKTGEYVFLEVNPCGQFGMTSKPCNYNLEMKVAEYLNDNK